MISLPISKARSEFTEILNKVHYQGERIIIQKHDKNIGAIISIDDLELLEAIEDYLDIKEARAAIAEAKEKGTTPWSEIEKELNL